VARRPLLTDEERRLLFGVPGDPDALARHHTFTRSDQDLVTGRRGAANRLGFAVQLALLSHPGMGLAQMEEPVEALVEWLAAQLDIPAAAFSEYAGRPQTMTDHALFLARTLGLRPPNATDLPFMIEAAAQSAWGTDRGQLIVAAVNRPARRRRTARAPGDQHPHQSRARRCQGAWNMDLKDRPYGYRSRQPERRRTASPRRQRQRRGDRGSA
jgi:hypothetical protein